MAYDTCMCVPCVAYRRTLAEQAKRTARAAALISSAVTGDSPSKR